MTNYKILITAGSLLILAVYLYTMHPTISPYRDSGDLIVASHTVGIAHPPGYPLYSLLGKIFTEFVPWSNIAYRINFMSAFFGAAAFILLGLTFLDVFGGNPWILLTLLLLAFSPAYWRLSQVSEMYSMNAFFTALIIYLSSRQKAEYLCVIAFVCGIATGNHLTIVLMYPALLWLLWKYGNHKVSDFLRAAIFFALGASVYLFLPVRSAAGPLANWGDPESVRNFFRVITRADYGGMKLHPEESKFSWSIPIILQHLWVYLKILGAQFTWAGAALGLWGIYVKRKERFFIYLFSALALSGPIFIIFSNLPPAEKTTLPILEPHMVMPGIFFAFFIAAGAEKFVSGVLGKAALGALVVIAFAMGLPLCSYRNSFYAYDYGRNLLSTVPVNGMIYNPDDSTSFITAYFQTVQNKRNDVKIAEFFRTRWGYEQIKKRQPYLLPDREILSGQELERVLLDFNRAKLPIFAELPSKFPQGYDSHPYGLFYKLNAPGDPLPSDYMFSLYSMRNNYRTPENDFFTAQIMSYYAASRTNLGLAYADKKLYGQARQEYLKALSIDPALEAAENDLGTLEYFTGNYGAAEQDYLGILKADPASVSVSFNLGLVYKAEKKFPAAEQCFSKLWNDSRSPEAGNELGLLLLADGRVQPAVDIFTDILNSYPQYNYAYYNLGLALKQAGRYSESRRYFEAYLGTVRDPGERGDVQKMLNSLPRN